jgi:molecular chaperone GrpE (heat shock protein)
MPPVLQEELAASFEAEKRALLAQIAALSEDAAQSQQAFDTYRERAKQSLLKAAAEQRVSEGAAAVLREQLQASCGVFS